MCTAGGSRGAPATFDLAGSLIEEQHTRELIDLDESAKTLGVSTDHVRTLIRRGYLAKAGERPSRSRHIPAILVRRADIERLADEGWPGRMRRRTLARDHRSGVAADDPGGTRERRPGR